MVPCKAASKKLSINDQQLVSECNSSPSLLPSSHWNFVAMAALYTGVLQIGHSQLVCEVRDVNQLGALLSWGIGQRWPHANLSCTVMKMSAHPPKMTQITKPDSIKFPVRAHAQWLMSAQQDGSQHVVIVPPGSRTRRSWNLLVLILLDQITSLQIGWSSCKDHYCFILLQ